MRRPANDDRESIGQILRTLQRRPARTSYMFATVFAGLWVFAGLVLGWMYLPQLQALVRATGLTAPVLAVLAADLPRADRLLLRARPHGVALPGIAAHHPVHGRSRHAAGGAGDGRARIDRHRRPGDPARSRRHGRRHRTRACARRRARDVGRQRGLRPRTRLQRQRGAYPGAAAGSGQPARYARRPGRPDPRRHQQRPSRSQPRHFADQRARCRAGQRGFAAHHPYARRKGRAHHARARTCRRHDDRDARRARRRPARPARERPARKPRRRFPPPATV